MNEWRFEWKVASALIAFGVLLGLICVLFQGPLPGDVALTRALQETFGANAEWAAAVTRSAKHPLVWLTLATAVALGAVLRRDRLLLTPVIAWIFVKIIDLTVRAMVHAPKPEPGLVEVASASTSSGVPSSFALTYAAIFGGLVLIAARSRDVAGRTTRRGIAAIALTALAVGTLARVVPGGHWMSQMLASLAVGLGVAWLVMLILSRGRRGQ